MKRLALRAGVVPSQRVRPVRTGGFNLLPHRQLAARRERRRRIVEVFAGIAAGCVAVLILAAWQTVERVRLDAGRASFERSLAQLSAPLAEHKRLARAAEQARMRAEHAAMHSKPLVHLLSLLDALSSESDDKVSLRQLRQREHETELLASAHDHAAPASWVKRLAAIRGVKDAEVKDQRRATAAMHGAGQNASGAIEFSARLEWEGTREPTVRNVAPAAARTERGAHMRGLK
ncbi:fimbrial assembly protein [Paraburkholderia sp. SOS3]|jgi:type II secretory pathway component PulM|uniref:fimbrial assembly protein n=1 Tax=Paraburkholderia sp. SOS3 TaxID=1926494 RepID=UPI0018DCE3D9|nr:fimbrial assembly protein [Paraburkholderia sp. SOS3]